MAEIREAQAEMQRNLAKLENEHDKTERALRSAIRLAVKEARAERERRKELDAKQNAMDEKFNVVIHMMDDWIRRQGNGKTPS